MHTDLNVGMYFGHMGANFWDPAMWTEEIGKHEVGIFHIYLIRLEKEKSCLCIWSKESASFGAGHFDVLN
jgi:hypothetical protein